MTIQLKRTLNSNITSYNPKDGEVVLDFNARNFKVGNSNKSYNELEYWIKRPIPSIYDGMNLTKELEQYKPTLKNNLVFSVTSSKKNTSEKYYPRLNNWLTNTYGDEEWYFTNETGSIKNRLEKTFASSSTRILKCSFHTKDTLCILYFSGIKDEYIANFYLMCVNKYSSTVFPAKILLYTTLV